MSTEVRGNFTKVLLVVERERASKNWLKTAWKIFFLCDFNGFEFSTMLNLHINYNYIVEI